MPTLDWIGKKAVVNHHREVPYRLVHCDGDLSMGDPDSGNLLVQGDNLEALKALLPYYAGKVKCIYIDPPYNTGNEKWKYNDNVNSAEIKSWLGKVVGKEAEDLSRHDKWLCMMYPRLRLLKEFLTEDGAIVISINDVEVASLRLICDALFGKKNFVSTICWQNIYTVKNSSKYISGMHDFLLVYSKNKEIWRPNLRPRDTSTDEGYTNPDNDPRGVWISHALQSRNHYSKGLYKIDCPGGRVIEGPPDGTFWRTDEDNLWKLHGEGRVWWGKEGNNSPRIKEFLEEAKDGVVPTTWWSYKFAGANSGAKTHLRGMLTGDSFFDTPKPMELLERVLDLTTTKNSLIMDAFCGSGTTGHAVLKKNKTDGGQRRFILVETDSDVATKSTGPRLKMAVDGYEHSAKQEFILQETPITLKSLASMPKTLEKHEQIKDEATGKFSKVTSEIREGVLTTFGENEKALRVAGLGGGFRYCRLGVPLFNEFGDIDGGVTFPDLAAHVFFAECGVPIPAKADGNSPYLGQYRDKAVYLLFSPAEAGFAREASGNVLTPDVLAALPTPPDGFEGGWIVYGEGCTVGKERLAEAGVTFKQIPYQIEGA